MILHNRFALLLKRYNARKFLGNDFEDFIREIVLININRIKILNFIMFFLFLVLILLDIMNFKDGKWEVSSGYQVIFYSHLSAIVLLLVFSGILFAIPVNSVNRIKPVHKRLNQIMIQLFCFHMTVIAMGDTLINGTIAAFMGSIFAIASFVFTSNGFGFQLFFSNLILMLILLLYASEMTGESYAIQMMNAVIYVTISFLLSRFLFYYQLRDFANRKLIKKQNQELENLAMHDHLTGALNRRSFLKKATEETTRSIRYQYPVSVILFDIDFFKKVNDTFGHAAGDAVLVSISRLIYSNIRSSDLFCRWGGEEFILLSPEADAQKIMKIAEKLRTLIEQNKPANTPEVTASFGVTQYRESEPFDKMIQRADTALYEAKENGRNCVRYL